MKRFDIQKITLNQVLTVIACFIAFVIILSTILGLAKKSAEKKNIQIAQNPSIVVAQGQEALDGKYYSFKNMERMRIIPAADKGQNPNLTIIVSPYFSYQKDDKEFFEELSRKNPVIKSIIINYFSSKTEKQLKQLNEDKIKADLKDLINQNLVLNQIENVYFSEYIFLQ